MNPTRAPVDARTVVAALSHIPPDQLAARCRADGLARLARTLDVSVRGPKATVAARITHRARLLQRSLTMGDDPTWIARMFPAQSLRRLARGLGGNTNVSNDELGSEIIAARNQLLWRIHTDLNDHSKNPAAPDCRTSTARSAGEGRDPEGRDRRARR